MRNRDRIKAALAAAETPRQQLDLDLKGLAALLLGGPNAKLNPTQEAFVFGPERINWYVGPLGCAKSTSLVTRFIIPALLYPGTRWFLGRLHYWTLQETTMKDFDDALARLGSDFIVDDIIGPPRRVLIASAKHGQDGKPVAPSEFIFHGLDDFEKLGSIKFTGIGVDEANEISHTMFTTLNGRLRYPRPMRPGEEPRPDGKPKGPFFLSAVSNPVRRSHWLHQNFCNESDCTVAEPMGKKYKPLPRENAHNLPDRYYEDAAIGMTPEQKMRMIDGECGPDPSGKRVFEEFNHQLHVGNLKIVAGVPMIRGWDFGKRRPACVFSQLLPNGWLNRLACLMGDNVMLDTFADRILNMSAMLFSIAPSWLDFCDPHGDQKRDVSEKTSVSVLRAKGINPRWRDTLVENGIELMGKGLNTLISGRPRSMFDKTHCALLIEAYGGGYQYAPDRQGVAAKATPLKDGYYEHSMDADRYIEVNLSMGSTSPLGIHAANLSRRRRNG